MTKFTDVVKAIRDKDENVAAVRQEAATFLGEVLHAWTADIEAGGGALEPVSQIQTRGDRAVCEVRLTFPLALVLESRKLQLWNQPIDDLPFIGVAGEHGERKEGWVVTQPEEAVEALNQWLIPQSFKKKPHGL